MLIGTIAGCNQQQRVQSSPDSSAAVAAATPHYRLFSGQELQQFTALNPIDTHAHFFQSNPELYAMLDKLNLHVVDILVIDDTNPNMSNVSKESQAAWNFIHGSHGRASLCTTFDPYKFNQPDFAAAAIRQINQEFAKGAIAVKIWKNIGMEIKDAKGNYILPDNPVFEPIYKDIAAHNKTLIAHLAEPSSSWEPPNPASPDYDYYKNNPQWYMYAKSRPASKEQILQARDHLVAKNPNLRVVGAHLGSLEANFNQLGQDFDRYPNFAADLAARMPYLMLQPRADMIAFVTKYQDRLIYGTDNELEPGERESSEQVEIWEDGYANDWRFLATNDTLDYQGHKIQGLNLPQSILRKLYHDNAVHWFPGILKNSPMSPIH
jgi:predicted TIM-barrel fold metal-dependent hydrolase